MKYCIYSNAYFNDYEMNIEHIIPKSLGGSDDLIKI
ncbi:HNH endonuclease [Clostridium acetireducens]|nr:HNH endonuclease [Clostridium acetireducens]